LARCQAKSATRFALFPCCQAESAKRQHVWCVAKRKAQQVLRFFHVARLKAQNVNMFGASPSEKCNALCAFCVLPGGKRKTSTRLVRFRAKSATRFALFTWCQAESAKRQHVWFFAERIAQCALRFFACCLAESAKRQHFGALPSEMRNVFCAFWMFAGGKRKRQHVLRVAERKAQRVLRFLHVAKRKAQNIKTVMRCRAKSATRFPLLSMLPGGKRNTSTHLLCCRAKSTTLFALFACCEPESATRQHVW
jgi:hypothetical protein